MQPVTLLKTLTYIILNSPITLIATPKQQTMENSSSTNRIFMHLKMLGGMLPSPSSQQEYEEAFTQMYYRANLTMLHKIDAHSHMNAKDTLKYSALLMLRILEKHELPIMLI